MGKLIKRIPGSRLLISSLPGSALRTHVESLGKPRDIKPCQVNLISKDTHLVLYIELTILLSVDDVCLWFATFVCLFACLFVCLFSISKR